MTTTDTDFEHWAIVYLHLSGPHALTNQGVLGCKTTGPFPSREAAERFEAGARSMEGPGYVRPMVDPLALPGRWSAD